MAEWSRGVRGKKKEMFIQGIGRYYCGLLQNKYHTSLLLQVLNLQKALLTASKSSPCWYKSVYDVVFLFLYNFSSLILLEGEGVRINSRVGLLAYFSRLVLFTRTFEPERDPFYPLFTSLACCR